MSVDATPDPEQVRDLLAGPRGRRFLLEYALAAELRRTSTRTERTFGYAVMNPATPPDDVTVLHIAGLLDGVDLADASSGYVRSALVTAVGHARYWEGPDRFDLLATHPEMRPALRRVAEHVLSSPLALWWSAPAAGAQYAIRWDGASANRLAVDVHRALREARAVQIADEAAASAQRASDEKANWSGDWWSRPPESVPSSTQALFDDSPAGLWFTEDSLDWERAEAVPLNVPRGASVFEIARAADWAELCSRFPLDVTAQKQDDWFRATAHSSSWVVPDWVQVAEHYDGVHLQVGAYLAAAGTTISVDETGKSASVIAGWNPDATYWFSSDVIYGTSSTQWVLEDDREDMFWRPLPTDG